MKNAHYFRGTKGRMVTSPETTPGGQQSYTENTELKINPANLEFYVRKKKKEQEKEQEEKPKEKKEKEEEEGQTRFQ